MKTIVITFIFVTLLLSGWRLPGQQQSPKYYRVDKVKTIKGKVTDIKFEQSYHKKDFTVIYLKEKKTDAVYRVEVSPKWFYSLDLMVGTQIEVTGSYSTSGGMNTILTRSITCQGEQFQFRDKHGFPMWRGSGKGKGRGTGKGRGGSSTNSRRSMF